MKMNEINVRSDIVVSVNKNGDTITVNVEDQGFIERFYGLIDRLNAIEETMKSEEVKKLGQREQLQRMIAETKCIMADIDVLFGEGCCRKAFGDIVPSPYLIADFFDQLTPIAEQYMNERQKRIESKYSRGRKGGRQNV